MMDLASVNDTFGLLSKSSSPSSSCGWGSDTALCDSASGVSFFAPLSHFAVKL